MPKVTISDKTKAKYALIFLSVVFFNSFMLALWHWYLFFSPTVLIVVIQIVGTYKQWTKWIKGKFAAIKYRKQRKANDLPISTTEDHLHVKLITISEWLVTDMIQATCNKDYSSCTNYDHYQVLMCQYTDAKADDDIVSYKQLMKRKLSVSGIYTGVSFNIEILKERWSTVAAEYLRDLKPEWDLPVRPFTPVSYLDDCKFMESALISKKIEIERIDKQLEQFFKGDSGTAKTAEQYTQQLEDLLVDMATVQQGTVYNLEGMKVSKLASLERARNRHIKHLQQQAKPKH